MAHSMPFQSEQFSQTPSRSTSQAKVSQLSRVQELCKMLDPLPQPVWIMDAASAAAGGNKTWRAYTGMSEPVISGHTWLDWTHPKDAARALPVWEHTRTALTGFEDEMRIRGADGTYRWFLVSGHYSRGDETSETGHWYLTCSDIHERVTARKELANSVEMQKTMLDVSVDCIKILRTDGTLAHMNLSGCRALGVSPDSGFGMKWLPLLPPEIHESGLRAFRQALRGSAARFAGKSVVPGKPPQYWDNILTPMLDDDGKTVSILCVSRDVTQQEQAEERLRNASEIDELTELPNRRAFKANLQPSLAKARTSRHSAALLLIDLDHFKQLNDTHGHAAGDHLLQVLARRFQSVLPEQSLIARVGGDEFAIVLWQIEDEAALLRIAHRLMVQLDPPIHFASKRINCSMSVGGAMYPRDARDAATLMRHADVTLNDMKASGRVGVRMFHSDLLRPLEQLGEQLEQARRVIRQDSVVAYYQPKVQLADGKPVGLEALQRYNDPKLGLLLPATVFGAFSDYELATRLGESLRAKVFKDIRNWQDAGLPVLPVSLNASPVEFMRDDYAERLLRQMEKAEIAPSLIALEITEQALEERGTAYMVRALKLLKHAGIRIALDDFGLGHSSLTRLREFPIDGLKIDASFVSNFGSEPAITAVIAAIGQFGPSLSLEIIAEGVETETQRQMLLDAGYRIGQGFLFSEAVSGDTIRDHWLGNNQTAATRQAVDAGETA